MGGVVMHGVQMMPKKPSTRTSKTKPRKKRKEVLAWGARWIFDGKIIGDPVPALYKTKRLAKFNLYIEGATEIVRVSIRVLP